MKYPTLIIRFETDLGDMRRAFAIAGLLLGATVAWAAEMELCVLSESASALWLMNAVMLALILRIPRNGPERLAALVAAPVCISAAGWVVDGNLVTGLRVGISNGVEIVLAAALLWRAPLPLVGPRAFLRFALGPVLAAPLIAGGVAYLLGSMAGVHRPPLWPISWASSDTLGMLVAGPLALNFDPGARLGARRLAIVGLALIGVLGVASLVFTQTNPLLFMLLYPVIVVAALSDRELGGPLAIVAVALVAVIAVGLNLGPPIPAEHRGLDEMMMLQLFLASLVVTALPVTALVHRLDLQAGELEARRSEAEELNAVKTKLLAHVSHEIRSPLSGVTSLAQLLSEGVMGDLTPRQREGLSQIAQSGAEVEALARDLLDAATLQSGKASVHIVDIEVEDALEAAVAAARFRAKEYGGSVVILGSYAPELRVAADRLRMRQILINLIVNGLKYGGRPPLVHVAAYTKASGMVRFEISDNGSGVSPELRQTLFRSFDRLGAEKSDIEGAGLGLALSRELAQLQGGTLGLEDGDLGGARFWLELPLWREQDGAAEAA